MLDNQYPWIEKNPDGRLIQAIVHHFAFNQLTSRVLANRFSSLPAIQRFFDLDSKILIDPSHLSQIDLLKRRLETAVAKQEKIVIYGDYDADGITSSAILMKTLRLIGAKVDYYIPNRFKDGYGPNLVVYQHLIDTGAAIIFAIDNGISGYDAVELANQNGVDVLIADHHELPEKLPRAKVIIHPELSPDYSFKDLSAAGIAYKIAEYLLGDKQAEQFLPLTAVGEIADVMPLIGENRILIKKGLQLLKDGRNLGLLKLAEKADLKLNNLSAVDVAFKIAPRLNSLGRMADAATGVELLVSDNEKKIVKIVDQVEHLNKQRQKEVEKIYDVAKKQVSPQGKDVIIAAGDNWHEGVIGIVAGRLSSAFGRPAVVFSIRDGIAKGSARSVSDFDIFAALKKADTLFISFGGHKQAAGLSLKAVDLDKFAAKINAHDYRFQSEKMQVDAQVQAQDLSIQTFQQLRKLAPFGEANPQPILELKHVRLANSQILGSAGKHFKLKVIGFNGDILFFNRPDLIGKIQIGETLSIVGTLSLNEWQQRQSLQLIALDIKSEENLPDRLTFTRMYKHYYAQDVLYSPNDFYQKVFLELGFVKIVNGVVFVLPEAKHAELSESDTYRKRAENGN
ncbi:single-stranded-DNA-specific exonuclease RecJ [Oenococcus sicerae]|uniref:Single-stranded-DNA-specific exonuclease RecJ n=1 Tax=Oenococcus sicerae TaxID=2203724 RepID=A0ABX5QNX1_9LACO|nr:single-stranded-DNA-specific exonuclease RecJ [Oenococcus sicerae]QAS70486.1 single-stranded-DNA-specific exonuclease RecJ [Oenococcus sicerae]